MVQILNRESFEKTGPLIASEDTRPSKLVWLFTPFPNKRIEADFTIKEPVPDPGILVGTHRYWIRAYGSTVELCRSADDPLIAYEVLHSQSLGITREDIEDAVCKADEELAFNKVYPISDRIKKQLQIIYDSE